MSPASRPNWRPGRAMVGSWALALGLGGLGGWLFFVLALPLPWMLGAITANSAAAIAGFAPKVPEHLRSVMFAVLGVMLGSSFTPDVFSNALSWLGSLAVLFLSGALTMLLANLYFMRVSKFGPVTRYFSSAPGGLTEMVIVGTSMGGDDRIISLVHALRILLVVYVVSFAFQWFAGYVPSESGPAVTKALNWIDVLWLVGSAVVGWPLGYLMRLPAPRMFGPMLASAVVHATGLTTSHVPFELVAAAQLVTGAAIGCRFVGISLRRLWDTALISFGSAILMMAVALGCALAFADVLGIPWPVLMLAYTPGGVTEMGVIALSLNQEVAFVATHHIARILMVIGAAPLAFRLMFGRNPRPPEAEGGEKG